MLKTIHDFFNKQLLGSDDGHHHNVDQLHLATAALLIEMTRVDHQRDDAEMATICRSLKRAFSLSDETLQQLLELAESEAGDMTSYYEFSTLIKNGFDYDERVKVVEMLWEVAHADGRIDTYEEHMIRKIAGLLYVKREDIVRSKHSALSHHQQVGQ